MEHQVAFKYRGLEEGSVILASREGHVLDKVNVGSGKHVDEYLVARYAALLAAISETTGMMTGFGKPLEVEATFSNTRLRIIVEDEVVRILVE